MFSELNDFIRLLTNDAPREKSIAISTWLIFVCRCSNSIDIAFACVTLPLFTDVIMASGVILYWAETSSKIFLRMVYWLLSLSVK